MRTLKLVGLAAVGAAALTACSNVQGAALYVDDERVSESTIDGYVDQVADLRAGQGEDLAVHDYTSDRQQVVFFAVVAEIGRELELDPAAVSDDTDDLNALVAEASGYYDQLYARAEPRELTEEETQAFNQAVTADNQMISTIMQEWIAAEGLTEAEVQQLSMQAQADPTIITDIVWGWAETQAGFSDDLASYVEEYDIIVNPRYGEIDLSPLPGVFTVEIPQR